MIDLDNSAIVISGALIITHLVSGKTAVSLLPGELYPGLRYMPSQWRNTFEVRPVSPHCQLGPLVITGLQVDACCQTLLRRCARRLTDEEQVLMTIEMLRNTMPLRQIDLVRLLGIERGRVGAALKKLVDTQAITLENKLISAIKIKEIAFYDS
jgi:hypothetical protein